MYNHSSKILCIVFRFCHSVDNKTHSKIQIPYRNTLETSISNIWWIILYTRRYFWCYLWSSVWNDNEILKIVNMKTQGNIEVIRQKSAFVSLFQENFFVLNQTCPADLFMFYSIGISFTFTDSDNYTSQEGSLFLRSQEAFRHLLKRVVPIPWGKNSVCSVFVPKICICLCVVSHRPLPLIRCKIWMGWIYYWFILHLY